MTQLFSRYTSNLSSSQPPDPRVIYHPNRISQYTYNGPSSCTYCSIEACLYFLHGFIDSNMRATDLHRILEIVLSQGVSMDYAKDGYRSADEVLQRVERFLDQLKLNAISRYNLSNDKCFLQLIESIKKKAQKKHLTKMAVVLTKPPITIAVFYDSENSQYPFCLFDSHSEGDKGASFRFCSEKMLVQLLKRRFQLFDRSVFGAGTADDLVTQQYFMFEASFFSLRSEMNQLMDPMAYSKYKSSGIVIPQGLQESALDYSFHNGNSISYSKNAPSVSDLPSAPQQDVPPESEEPEQEQTAPSDTTHTPSDDTPQQNDYIPIIRTLVDERKVRNKKLQQLERDHLKLKQDTDARIKQRDEKIAQLEEENKQLSIEKQESAVFQEQLENLVQSKDDTIQELRDRMACFESLASKMDDLRAENADLQGKYGALMKEFSSLLQKSM